MVNKKEIIKIIAKIKIMNLMIITSRIIILNSLKILGLHSLSLLFL